LIKRITSYCSHSRLAARQPNDVISVLDRPLKRRLAGLICIVHPTGCTATAVVQPVVQLAVKCKHRVRQPTHNWYTARMYPHARTRRRTCIILYTAADWLNASELRTELRFYNTIDKPTEKNKQVTNRPFSGLNLAVFRSLTK